MIVTQTYSYIMRAGFGYECVVTGYAIVFLDIKQEEPGTVYYYHADPQAEVNNK